MNLLLNINKILNNINELFEVELVYIACVNTSKH